MKLTYGDFIRTGYQDCANTFDVSDYRDAWRKLGKPHGSNAARRIVRAVWGDDDDAYKTWLSQADVDEILGDGLDLRSAYKAWREAWQGCAESAVKARLLEWIESDRG